MRRPNLLFLYTDEQRFDTLAPYGNSVIAMPNLNRLAGKSVVFERAYVTQPVCTPSRSSLLTGLYPHTSGMTSNNLILSDTIMCLPEMTSGDHACAHFGKWHLGNEIYPQHGFTDWRSTEDSYHDGYTKVYNQMAGRSAYHHWLIDREVVPESRSLPESTFGEKPWLRDRFFREQIMNLPEPLSRPLFLAEQACDFIAKHRCDPWILYVNFLEQHMPFHSCRDGQYPPPRVTLPPNFSHELDASYPLNCRIKALQLRERGYEKQPLNSEDNWRALIARYWGMCSLVDTHAGRILDALTRLELDDSTVVVFTSDHGDMMGSHGLLGKSVMFEEAMRVPMIIRLPGQRTGRAVHNSVSQIDMVPTLLDLLGEPRPPHLQGQTLRPTLEGGPEPTRDIFVEWNAQENAGNLSSPSPLPGYAASLCTPERAQRSKHDSIRSVITVDGWKLNLSREDEHGLFDLSNDPCETRNLFDAPGRKERVSELTDKIHAWQERTRDHIA